MKTEKLEIFGNFLKNKKKKKKEKTKEYDGRLIKDKIIRDIRTLFEQQEEDHYKPKWVSNFWNNNYIKYECNGDKNSNLLPDEYLNKTKPYLRDIITDHQIFDTWKNQLTFAINFISSKETEE